MSISNLDLASNLLRVIFPIADEAIAAMVKARTTKNDIKDNKISEISSDTETIALNILKEQISIAQDLAIARRIETADEVEIEEVYDTSKEGNAGLKVDSTGMMLGASGKGRVITKRIYKFKGYNKDRVEDYEEAIASILEMNKKNN